MHVVHVLWDGRIGGAERFNASLAAEFRRVGVDAPVLFVGRSQPLAMQLDQLGVPYAALGRPTGSAILRSPRRFARLARAGGADAAILVQVGYLGVALRLGGYGGRIVGVEHGALLIRQHLPRRLLRLLDRSAALPAYDAEIAISSFMAEMVRGTTHVRRLAVIPHGINSVVSAPSARNGDAVLRVGHVSRLVPGKGADVVVRAVAEMRRQGNTGIRLDIAGEGPERPRLEALVLSLGLRDQVRFVGWVEDVPSFWADQDVATALGDEFVESFGLAALEAMACGKPLIVSRLGALPELVQEGATGYTVEPGDNRAIAMMFRRYADDPSLCREHGRFALERARSRFSLERCARDYLDLLRRL